MTRHLEIYQVPRQVLLRRILQLRAARGLFLSTVVCVLLWLPWNSQDLCFVLLFLEEVTGFHVCSRWIVNCRGALPPPATYKAMLSLPSQSCSPSFVPLAALKLFLKPEVPLYSHCSGDGCVWSCMYFTHEILLQSMGAWAIRLPNLAWDCCLWQHPVP